MHSLNIEAHSYETVGGHSDWIQSRVVAISHDLPWCSRRKGGAYEHFFTAYLHAILVCRPFAYVSDP